MLFRSAVFLGYLFADEVLNGRILVATAIIIGSVVLINSARQAKVKTEPLQAVSSARTAPRRSDGD